MERQSVAKVQKPAALVNHLQRRFDASSPAHPLLTLQRSIGNRALNRLIDSPYLQAKLEVSKPGDPAEDEADRVANTVMRMPDGEAEDESGKLTPVATEFTPEVQRQTNQQSEDDDDETPATPAIQRVPLAVREDDGEEEEEKVARMAEQNCCATQDRETTVATKPIQDATLLRQTKTAEEEETTDSAPPIQRKREEEEEQSIQPQSTYNQTPRVTPSLANNIRSLSGGGSPLSTATRAFFEPRFRSDFSQVRVHTDSRAAGMAKSLQAKAFTVGQNIAFGSGQYAPESQSGQQLLAHELTHVVQQNGNRAQAKVNASQNSVMRGPLDPAPAPGPPPSIRTPIELKGAVLFSPPDDVVAYFQARPLEPMWVIVKFGSLTTTSEIAVYWNPDTEGFYSIKPPQDLDAHPMPVENKAFPIVGGARPMLGINIENDIVTGYFGWITGKGLAKDPEQFFAEHPLSELFGIEGVESEPPDAGRNILSDGKLSYYQPVDFKTGDFEGSADVTLKDEDYNFDGEVWVDKVKGIDKPLPLTKEGGKVFGTHSWKFNRTLGEGGKLSGEIIGTFAEGKTDVRGTLNYFRAKPQISGSVTVLVTTFDIAKEKVRDQLGTDAPASIEPGAPGDSLAITGWGHLDFSFNEWMTGNADVIVHPEGYVTAKGEITPTKIIPILKKREEEKELLKKKEIDVPIPGLDVKLGDVAVVGSLKIDGYASLGPGTLHDLRVAGLFSTHPDIVNTFELSGIMSTPAIAGIVLDADVRIAGRLLKTFELISAGLAIKGDLALQLYAEAKAAAGRRVGDDGQPEYFLKGTLTGGAGLRLDLKLWLTGSVAFWSTRIDLHDRTYNIAGGRATIEFDYILGKKPKKGEDRFKMKLELGDFDQNKFAEAVVRGKTVGDDISYKGKEEEEGKLKTEENLAAPEPPDIPDPSKPPPSGPPSGVDVSRIAPITMEHESHTLFLLIVDPPSLMMQSAIQPLVKKIEQARKEIKKATAMGQAEKDARLASLKSIETSANAVQEAAARMAKNPTYITPQVSGFKELADLISDYGNKYDVKDLGPTFESIVVDPDKPESVLQRFSGLVSDADVKAQVTFMIRAGVAATDLRKIVENVRPIKEEGVRKLLNVLERMIKSGAANWDKVITDLRIGGNKFKGARFVLRYIDEFLGWDDVSFEVTGSDPVDISGRRWDARVNNQLYQFKSWYTWPNIASRTFLRQILEDYNKTAVGGRLGVMWVFETSLTKEQIVEKMKEALAEVRADLKAGRQPKVDGYTGGVALFLYDRAETFVKVVKP